MMRDWIFAIRGFSAALRLGSVTAASGELGISQPALSRAISNLEAELGFDLFHRERQRIVATPEGLQFFREAQRILNVYDQLPVVAQRIREKGQRAVRIVCLPRLAQAIVAPAVSAFQRDWPRTRLTVDVQARRNIETWVVAGDFDLALTSFPIEHRTLASRELFRAAPVAVLHRDNPLAGRKGPISVRELAGEPIITLLEGTHLRGVVDQAFGEAGLQPASRIEVSDAVLAVAVAANRGGIAITDPISGSLGETCRQIPIRGLPAMRFGIAWPEGRSLSQEADAFLSRVLEEIRKLNASGNVHGLRIIADQDMD